MQGRVACNHDRNTARGGGGTVPGQACRCTLVHSVEGGGYSTWAGMPLYTGS